MNWVDANEVLIELLQNAGVPPSLRTIGRIRYVGSGLSNIVFAAEVEFPAGRKQTVVVKLPSDDANDARDQSLRSEAALLGYLCKQPLPFRVPRPIAEIETAMGLGVVQEWVHGIPVDLRRFPGGKPWELVAQVAAAVHAIDPAPMRDWLPGYPTWQDHALGFASLLQELEEPEAEDTRAWVREHLPAPIASCLLHGDLLGQNLRRRWDPEGIASRNQSESQHEPAFHGAARVQPVKTEVEALIPFEQLVVLRIHREEDPAGFIVRLPRHLDRRSDERGSEILALEMRCHAEPAE